MKAIAISKDIDYAVLESSLPQTYFRTLGCYVPVALGSLRSYIGILLGKLPTDPSIFKGRDHNLCSQWPPYAAASKLSVYHTYFLELICIRDRTLDTLYSDSSLDMSWKYMQIIVSSLDLDLVEFFQRLIRIPPNISSGSDMQGLSILFHHTRMLVHRPCAFRRPSTNEQIRAFNDEAAAVCTESSFRAIDFLPTTYGYREIFTSIQWYAVIPILCQFGEFLVCRLRNDLQNKLRGKASDRLEQYCNYILQWLQCLSSKSETARKISLVLYETLEQNHLLKHSSLPLAPESHQSHL